MEQFFVCLGVIVVFLLAITPFVIWDTRKLNKKVEDVFGGRQELNNEDFYEKYFKIRGVPFYIVQKIRQIFDEELSVDLSRLSAKDDFSKNLSFFWEYDSLADVEIAARIEKEFNIKISDEEATNFYRTVDGIVNFVWQKVREKNESEN